LNFTPEFLNAVAGTDFCETYYAVCRDHPSRFHEAPRRVNSKALLKAARDQLSLVAVGGPGSVYRLSALPSDCELNIVVGASCVVETDFAVPFRSTKVLGTFPILANAANTVRGVPPHDPAYPRPGFCSIEEALTLFGKLGALVEQLRL
jgi:hypothetical protein